jgi:hypothetical protein
MSEFNLKTGDLILFDNGRCNPISYLIKFFTESEITHSGVILKDPDFIDPSLKGYYVWESGWEGKPDPQDGEIKFGVQITPFDEICDNYKQKNSAIFIRRINCPPEYFNANKLKEIHNTVYDKIYDCFPPDLMQAIMRKDIHPQKTNRFWCSALVGYIYTQCQILNNATDWSILRPSDFTEKGESILHFSNNTFLEDIFQIY